MIPIVATRASIGFTRGAQPATPIPAASPAAKDWTILFYNAGYRDEAKMCTASLLDAQQVGSDGHTNVVAMNFRSPWLLERLGINREYLGARTYYLTHHETSSKIPAFLERRLPGDAQAFGRFLQSSARDIQSPLLESHPADTNMGQAETLKKFLLDNIQKYPARHYAVIVSGHGAAFGGQAIVHQPEGRISNNELGTVLEEVTKTIGKKIDLLDLNTCFAANVETLVPLQKAADAVVASEGTIFGATQPFGRMLSDIQQAAAEGVDLSGPDLARLLVEESRRQPLGNLQTGTLSAVDLSRLTDLTGALDAFQQSVMQEKVPPALLRQAFAASTRMDYSSLPKQTWVADVGSFAAEVAARCSSNSVKQKAAEVQQALKHCVIGETHSRHEAETLTGKAVRMVLRMPEQDLAGLSGLTMYLDDDAANPDSRLDQIGKTRYAALTHAEAFLRYMGEDGTPQNPLRRALHAVAAGHTKVVQKLDRVIGIPFAVSVGEKVALAGGTLAGFHALQAAGIPAYPLLFGTYFTGRGIYQMVDGTAQAVKLVTAEKRSPADTERLVTQASRAAVGAAMGTFGLYLLGVLPHAVAWPAAIVAVSIRGLAQIGQVWAHRKEAQALRDEAEAFHKLPMAEKLKP